MKSTTFNILILTLFIIVVSSPLSAQETLSNAPAPQETVQPEEPAPIFVEKRTFSVGLFGGYSLDLHHATDLKLPDIPSCCPGYDGGTGGGFIGGLSIEFPLTSDLELLGRLSYNSSSVDMTTDEPITVRIDDQPVESVITHTLSTTTTFLNIEPAIAFRIVGDLSLLGGFRIAALTGMTYDQRSVLDPSIPYDFEGGSGVRDASSGTVETTSAVNFGILVGARYALGLNQRKTLILAPEVQFAPLLTSMVDSQSWSMSSFRFMLGVSYAFTTHEKEASPLTPDR